jgi:simple sugar transport system ATP-binding protein
VDPRARLWQLSVGEQQRVEILKVLHRGARILVLDEPTAVLAPAEAEELGRTLRQLAARGRAIVFISHKLDEVRALADRVTVLRRGRVVAAGLGASSVEPAALARLMVGRDLEKPAPRRGGSPGAPVLAVEGLEALSDRGLPALRGVTLTVSRGEILGVAGVAGNGQRELCEVVTGLRGLRAGRVRLDGEDVTGAGPRELITRGVGHVPEDRAETGAAGGLSLAENLALKGYRVPPLKRGPWLDRAALRDRAARLIGEYDVQPPAVDAPAGALSGGNLQRLILAREIAAAPRLLVAAQPTRGLDVGATEAVHRLLQLLRDRGSAILLVSADLDEIRGLADRIIVLFEGRIAGEVAPDTNRATIGLLMAGGAAPAVAEA